MKKMIGLTVLLGMFVSGAYAEDSMKKAASAAPAQKAAQEMTYTGDIIDNRCAKLNKKGLSAFVPAHTKECALMPACIKSGYSIYTKEGELIGFTEKSNKLIEEFLRKPDSKLQVTIKAKKARKNLSLISIQNKL